MADLKVGIACTVIPDDGGLDDKGRPSSLRFSVLMAPILAPGTNDPLAGVAAASTRGKGGIDLRTWPEEIMRAMKSGEGGVRVYLRTDHKGAKPGPWASVDLVDPEARRTGYEERIGQAREGWKRAFGGGDDAAYAAVITALNKDSGERSDNAEEAQKFAAKRTGPVPLFKHLGGLVDPTTVDAPSTQFLADSLHWMHATDLLRPRLPRGGGEFDPLSLIRRRSWLFADQFKLPALPGFGIAPDYAPRISHSANLLRHFNPAQLQGMTSRAKDDRVAQVQELRKGDDALRLPEVTSALASFSSLANLAEFTGGAAAVRSALEMHALATSHERPHDIDTPNPEDDNAGNIARRRLVGLRSNPTLAKLVQMTVDVEWTVAASAVTPLGTSLLSEWFGEVCAEFVADFKALPAPKVPVGLTVTKASMFIEANRLYFGPASRHEHEIWDPSTLTNPGMEAPIHLPLEHGFLNMRAQPGRFRIRTFDSTLGVAATMEGVAKRSQASAQGANEMDINQRLPSLRSCGMEIIDVQSGPSAYQDMARVFGLDPEAKVCFAEDLLSGFRVDVEVTRASRTSWHSATARTLTYQGIKLPKGKKHLFPDFEHRDEGLVQAFIRQVKVPGKPAKDGKPAVDPHDVFFARQELFTWTGAPVSLPMPHAMRYIPPSKAGATLNIVGALTAGQDVNIGVDYGFLPGEDNLLPPLRMGYGYRFVFRACYANGGGPRFKPVTLKPRTIDTPEKSDLGVLLPTYNKVALGSSGTAAGVMARSDKTQSRGLLELPTLFALHDPVGGPQLVLPADDGLVTSRSLEALPSERINEVVLRWDGNPLHDGVRRILLPPRVAFDQAELQGQFDTSSEAVPGGALRQMQMEPQGGALPQAAGGGIVLTKPLYESDDVERAGEHRGPVFVPRRGAKVIHPFYADRRARRVIVSLSRAGEADDDIAPPCTDLYFWEHGAHPDSAQPVVVEFRLAKAGAKGARFIGKPMERDFDIGGRFKAMHLLVEVGLAEKIEVRAWCIDEDGHQNHALLRTLVDAAAVPAKSPDGASSFEEVKKLLAKLALVRLSDQKSPVIEFLGTRHAATLSDLSAWSVTAAVRRPIHPPAFVDRKTGGLALGFTRLKSGGALKAWDGIMSKGMSEALPFEELEGSVAFLRGQLAVHRRSTQSLRMELVWREFDDSVCLLKKKDGSWEHRPQTRIEEQTLAIAADDKIAAQRVDIAVESWQQGKPVQFDVGTRAVRVGVRVVAKSRFENCFQEAAGAREDPSRFESESCPRQALLPDTTFESDRSIWIASTVRPPVPEVSRVELLYRPREVARSRSQVILESGWQVRVRLKAGTWFMSGEDEMLGVILMPQDLVDTARGLPASRHSLSPSEWLRSAAHRRLNLLQELPFTSRSRIPAAPAAASAPVPAQSPVESEDAQLRRRMQLHALVSGWGTDPSAEAGKLDATMSAGNFSGWSAKKGGLPLPFKLENPLGGNEEVEAQVSVIAYAPVLDSATGERFVDIDMLMPEVDGPFVRLSLARYQPHAMRQVIPAQPEKDGKSKAAEKVVDVSLSSQRLLDPMIIPATRRVEVNFSAGKVMVKVTGAAHQRRSPGLPLEFDTADGHKFLDDSRHLTDMPWMRIALQGNDGRGPFLGGDFLKDVPAFINGNQGIWHAEFDVGGLGRELMLFIEETVRGVSSVLPETGQTRPELLELPRGFKCDIPLTIPRISDPRIKEFS